MYSLYDVFSQKHHHRHGKKRDFLFSLILKSYGNEHKKENYLKFITIHCYNICHNTTNILIKLTWLDSQLAEWQQQKHQWKGKKGKGHKRKKAKSHCIDIYTHSIRTILTHTTEGVAVASAACDKVRKSKKRNFLILPDVPVI